MGVNEVNVNGENIIDLTRDTVNENNLLLNETATDSKGEKVQGKVNPAKKSEAYLVTDIVGDIENEDYIPFNDVSDAVTPKKKTLFSSIVAKIQTVFNSVFATVTGNNIVAKDTFRQNIHTLEWLGTDIPDNSDLDTYTTAGNYRVISDASGASIAHLPLALCGKVIVFNNGNGGIEQFYLANHSPRIFVRTKFGTDAWTNWLEITASSKAHTYDIGEEIPAYSDLNTYLSEGVYKLAPDARTENCQNVPSRRGGKLIVSNGYSSNNTYIIQDYIDNEKLQFRRRYNGSAWGDWSRVAYLDEITPSAIGDGYAVATISGNTITANITGFQLKVGTIVSLKLNGSVSGDCTININNTGAKYVRRNDYAITSGIILYNGTYTFIYDGTYYRLISTESIGSVHSFPRNYVADTSGSTVLDWGFNLNKAQIKYNLSTDKLAWNFYKNGAWRGDVNIADFKDIVTQLGYEIPQNSDFNNYTHAGVFYVPTQVYADTMINIPNHLSGKLIVMGVTDTNSFLRQFYFPNHEDKIYYRRLAEVGNWFDWVEITNLDDLGASIAKTGKSILPIWGYTTNTRTHNGVTYTFNPATGEITVNGTATNDSNCILAGNETGYTYFIPKGQYILTGCPSGGSSSKYYIRCQFKKTDNTTGNISEYGSGATLTLDKDAKCDTSTNQNYFIWVCSGQTVSNLVFKPMLRPAWTSADYEPCEDIHKGNCYVGTCTTAGATKDKVAYVDGYFVLRKGVRVAIKFSNTNTYSNVTSSPVTLNINNTGAKYIWFNNTHSGAGITGTNADAYGVANRYNFYVYDGGYWVWDGHGVDNNSTNFLPNNANAVLTTANSPVIAIKSSSIDSKQANNGVSSALFPAYLIQDKNGEVMSRLESVVETNGNISTFLYTRNIKTSDNTRFFGGIKIFSNKSGDIWYSVTQPHYFNSALGIGWGTCDTAEATTAKVVNFTRYIIATNGYVTVKFTHGVPANATMNINNQGARAIYYRGGAIHAGVIRAGDIATFIYANGYYNLIGVDRQSVTETSVFSASEVAFGDAITPYIKTTTPIVAISKCGNLLVGEIEFAITNSPNNVTVPSYNQTSTAVFCRMPNKYGYLFLSHFECHVDIKDTLIPAWISTGNIGSTNYIFIALRKAYTLTGNGYLRIQFTAVLKN